MAHHLGVASQTRRDDDPPGIVQPVFIKDDQGMLRPYRMMWPAFWGWLDQDRILPADPESIHRTIRRTLRVRTDFQQELAAPPASTSGGDSAGDPAATFRKRIEASLKKLAEKPPREASEPVYLAGGKVYRLGDSGELVEQLGAREAAPYAWALGHDVRPARQSLGSRGCQECHAGGAPIFHSVVRAVGPAPDSQPIERPMHQWSGYDTALLAAWERLFRLRPLFKWSAAAALALLVALLLAMIMRGVQRLVVALSRRLLHGRGDICGEIR